MAEYKIKNIIISDELPLIALKNTVLFPKIVTTLIVQRSKSVGALEYALTNDRLVLFVTQKSNEDNISDKELFQVGTIGRVVSVFKLPDGSSRIDVEGLIRAKVSRYISESPFFKVKVEPLPLLLRNTFEEKTLLRRAMDQFHIISEARSFPTILPEVIYMMSQIKDTEQIVSLMTINLSVEIDDQQRLLELESGTDVLRQLNVFLQREIDILEAEKSLAKETKKQIGKMQKEFFLREQLKNIEKELGVGDEKEEFEVLKNKIMAAGMPRDVEDKAIKELNRLGKMPAFNPEGSYIRTYLDWLGELPWAKKS